jgi:hypothetical protein
MRHRGVECSQVHAGPSPRNLTMANNNQRDDSGSGEQSCNNAHELASKHNVQPRSITTAILVSGIHNNGMELV